jgi:hypothetical protein
MRLLIPVLFGTLAVGLSAQGIRGGGHARGPGIRVPVSNYPFGAPQMPPGTAINGVPGLQTGVSLNGLPAFSNRYYNFGCYNCGTRGRARSSAPVLGVVPFVGGLALPDTYSEEDMAPPPAPGADPATMILADEVNRLRGDIRQLQSEKQALATPPPPAPAAAPAPPEPPAPATVLVLRDGKQLETTNYAVMDQTLWNFSAHPVQKIPLTSIDLQASQKANSSRGIDFSLALDSDN